MAILPESETSLADQAATIEARFTLARQAVVDWMNAEGAEGRFRTNSQAPGWAEYEDAEVAFLALKKALSPSNRSALWEMK